MRAAATSDQRRRERIAAVVVAIAAVAAMVAVGAIVLWYRHGAPRSSRAGDACPVTSHGGLVGLDARTGAVRWTNIVPPDGQLDEVGDQVHLRTVWHPEPTDRTVRAADGAIVRCEAITDIDPSVGPLDIDRMKAPAHVGDLTVVLWGSGLRATDASGRGVWGTTNMSPRAVLGDHAIVERFRQEGPSKARIALVDLRDGSVGWEVPGIVANAEAPEALVIARAGSDGRTYRALDARTGAERWRARLPRGERRLDPQAWEAGGLVAFSAGPDGRLVVVDATTGARRWTARADTPGRNRHFPLRGEVRDVAAEGTTLVVAVDAAQSEELAD